MSAKTHNYMTDGGVKRFVLHSDYAALEARHNALKEAVAWEREFDEVLVWLVRTGQYPRDMASRYDLANERECARAEVDRLIANETADCKGEESCDSK